MLGLEEFHRLSGGGTDLEEYLRTGPRAELTITRFRRAPARALVHGWTLVTRNVADLRRTGVATINPFTRPADSQTRWSRYEQPTSVPAARRPWRSAGRPPPDDGVRPG